MELRATALNKAIMCPICPGESIDQAQNDLAIKMRAIVREKLAEGESEDEIKQFFVEGYGPSVLLEPPRQGFSLVAWIVPPVAVAGGIALFLLALRMMRRPRLNADGVEGVREPVSDDGLEPYYARIEAAIGEGIQGKATTDKGREDEGGGR